MLCYWLTNTSDPLECTISTDFVWKTREYLMKKQETGNLILLLFRLALAYLIMDRQKKNS